MIRLYRGDKLAKDCTLTELRWVAFVSTVGSLPTILRLHYYQFLNALTEKGYRR